MRTHNLNATLQDIQQVLGTNWSDGKLQDLAGQLKGNSQPIADDISVFGWTRGRNKYYVCVSTNETVLHYNVDSQGKFSLPERRLSECHHQK